ncbi:hypothetical protein [Nocardia sp. NPDC050710]|uniref:hypothetical protein n=1 Tax=Nocardia sp. NPDC050710 TaxID=3157220 RepID=UPI0033E750B7
MSRFTFRTDDDSEEFFTAIAEEMVAVFGISEDEAIARINYQFDGQAMVGSDNVIYSEPEDFWARDLMYGHHTFWWRDEDAATPLPFPPTA